jgi:hypothetical protein
MVLNNRCYIRFTARFQLFFYLFVVELERVYEKIYGIAICIHMVKSVIHNAETERLSINAYSRYTLNA